MAAILEVLVEEVLGGIIGFLRIKRFREEALGL